MTIEHVRLYCRGCCTEIAYFLWVSGTTECPFCDEPALTLNQRCVLDASKMKDGKLTVNIPDNADEARQMITNYENKMLSSSEDKAQCSRCRQHDTEGEHTPLRGWVCRTCAEVIVREQQQDAQYATMGTLV